MLYVVSHGSKAGERELNHVLKKIWRALGLEAELRKCLSKHMTITKQQHEAGRNDTDTAAGDCGMLLGQTHQLADDSFENSGFLGRRLSMLCLIRECWGCEFANEDAKSPGRGGRTCQDLHKLSQIGFQFGFGIELARDSCLQVRGLHSKTGGLLKYGSIKSLDSAEVVIDRSAVGTGLLRDLLASSSVEALFGEELSGHVE